ncbi:DUF4838 domain-containing protein [Niabella aurantiaca]|uniref:DUF4838 domain-containing protein n=1 Tax=Niabella aurantiaca TaxID=379900 RepID=UPI00039D1AD8|nr:DUF4838 domain-containing protein [Niabella aurantiaca]
MLLLLFCTGPFLPIEVGGQGRSGKTITRYKGTANEAIKDLNDVLKPYNAGIINISKVPLESRTGQEFYLAADNGSVTIKYTTQNSLENAIYTYLDLLGFRWYGPGDNWFVAPKALKRLSLAGKWIKPSFRNRAFFGTGGLDFGTPQPYDPQNLYKKKWYDWKRRNRFNADFQSVGHTGQAFYLQNKALLDAHPNWFTNESGKINGRIKVDQPAAVAAYKNWIKNIYSKSETEFTALGVDPEDGRGGSDDPLPHGMAGIKNHADKWWWLANQVAKDYPENDLHTVITAYAYGDGPYNALAPSFKLRKNVYPVIIPYAFQKAYQPEEMVKVWASKINGNMGIYDYWNITQWSKGLPQFDIYSIPEKLDFWTKNKIDGIYLETTDAAGPMGHALWLAGQLEWDVHDRFERLYGQYLDDCFGKAAPAMRRMFDRWSRKSQGAAEVSFSLNDLKEAGLLVAKKSAEWKRINELKAYVHFMKLYYEHDGTQESKDRLFRYLYSIHHLMLVQTAAFIGQDYIAPLNKGNIVPSGNGTRPISPEEIEQLFQKDLSVAARPYTLTDFQFDMDKVKYKEPIPKESWRFGGFQCRFYFKAPFSGMLHIDAGGLSETPFLMICNGKILVKETIKKESSDYEETLSGRTWNMKRFKIPVEKGKIYEFETNYGSSRIVMQTPGIVLFKNPGSEDFDNYAYPVQYFYVPQHTQEIVFYDQYPEGTNGRGYLIAPDGKVLKREATGSKNIYRVPVAQQYQGKVWKANFGHPLWGFKNIPNITSLQKFEYGE